MHDTRRKLFGFKLYLGWRERGCLHLPSSIFLKSYLVDRRGCIELCKYSNYSHQIIPPAYRRTSISIKIKLVCPITESFKLIFKLGPKRLQWQNWHLDLSCSKNKRVTRPWDIFRIFLFRQCLFFVSYILQVVTRSRNKSSLGSSNTTT